MTYLASTLAFSDRAPAVHRPGPNSLPQSRLRQDQLYTRLWGAISHFFSSRADYFSSGRLESAGAGSDMACAAGVRVGRDGQVSMPNEPQTNARANGAAPADQSSPQLSASARMSTSQARRT